VCCATSLPRRHVLVLCVRSFWFALEVSSTLLRNSCVKYILEHYDAIDDEDSKALVCILEQGHTWA
jgi:hypothetical protein